MLPPMHGTVRIHVYIFLGVITGDVIHTLMIPGRSTRTILFNCGPYTISEIGWREGNRNISMYSEGE